MTPAERDCKAFGINPAAFNLNRVEDRDGIPVWPDMLDAFALFCDAPWDSLSLGMGGSIRTNINRTQLEASSRLLGIAMTPNLFADIRVLEDEAVKYWSRKH